MMVMDSSINDILVVSLKLKYVRDAKMLMSCLFERDSDA